MLRSRLTVLKYGLGMNTSGLGSDVHKDEYQGFTVHRLLSTIMTVVTRVV